MLLLPFLQIIRNENQGFDQFEALVLLLPSLFRLSIFSTYVPIIELLIEYMPEFKFNIARPWEGYISRRTKAYIQ